jgi:GTP cyclohydrolase IB
MITVDAMKKSSETDQIPLQWVGMEKVTLPIHLQLGELKTTVLCDFDIFVDLVNPSKGIHMSRLYELLTHYAQNEIFSFAGLHRLLLGLVQSQNGLSASSKIGVSFSLPISSKTLKSGKQYFKSVPLQVNFELNKNVQRSEIKFLLEYSSTCPQSAALAHQLTVSELQKQQGLTGDELTAWYEQRGFIATPHAQRSQLDLTVVVDEKFEIGDFAKLFTDLGSVLGTPTQGIVKRVDEQEFARLNAENLMFCEDAARKVIQYVTKASGLISGKGKVSHLESLHSHNAVAYFQF